MAGFPKWLLRIEMFKQIVVATDGSLHAKKAEDRAIDLAGIFGSELYGVFVADELRYRWADELEGELLEKITREGRRILEDFKKKAESRGVAVSLEILEGTPPEEIVAFAESRGADLIVVGSRGLSGAEKLALGSAAERVIRRAHCPVLVVR